MHVSAQARFDATPERVAIMLADEEFAAAQLRDSGAVGGTVDVVGGPAGGFTVTTRRQMPTTGIPAHLRSLVGAHLEVRLVEAWEAAEADVRHGTVVMEVTGAPVRMTGTLRLAAEGGQTVLHLDGDLKAAIPLFGATVEEATAGAVRDVVASGERAAAAWLAEHP